jgi:hypothetical protein
MHDDDAVINCLEQPHGRTARAHLVDLLNLGHRRAKNKGATARYPCGHACTECAHSTIAG